VLLPFPEVRAYGWKPEPSRADAEINPRQLSWSAVEWSGVESGPSLGLPPAAFCQRYCMGSCQVQQVTLNE